ncbi:MAG: hypothetical protein COX81_00075 [Candidatus Magasanikbacteria bacterium CG_4_10_14_0_2_um_filter_37_12]|uniref:Phenylacetate--CoA ligase n=1 Tax=Candidatus Magasanikbacteria bacterium CG_4_10_14_0_2_um_filter_37_12 TaxID=1974637 RepID=A0A2M7VAF0_9BACT|nr:MAG: hypothetical protein COX81_00075 [Candidatus Magasanikbacteria bacterium CG_4_10_14_0_2_um_filter_37_12]
MSKGFKKALKTFYWTAENVPAYASFLLDKKIKYESIKTEDDFVNVPCMNKKNYLRKYRFEDLSPEGASVSPMISVSSGSSGVPFFWPRGEEQEKEGGIIHERIFRDIFNLKKDEKTLVVICFSMGSWIAGTYTVACCRYVSREGYNLSIVTPGINQEDTISVFQNFAKNFDRVILAGYPPFIMDILYEMKHQKINIKKMRLNLLFAGESFSEKWRDFSHKMAEIKDELSGSVNIYGTADAAVLGHESPLTVFLRRISTKDKAVATKIFGSSGHPSSCVHYYPEYKFFQEDNEDLIFTTKSGIPLVKYKIGDKGRILTNSELNDLTKEFSFAKSSLFQDLLKKWPDPIIILKNRDDVSVTFYALNIYPENIKTALEDSKLRRFFSGKFVATVRVLNHGKNQKLCLTLELGKEVKDSQELRNLAQVTILKYMANLNAEYRRLLKSVGKKAYPFIVLLPYSSENFIIKNNKHRWVKK